MNPPDTPKTSTRSCGIAGRLGEATPCPAGGCALLTALGEELPADARAVCPIEAMASGDNPIVLWTLNELRRELQGEPSDGAVDHPVEATWATRHTETIRRWS